MRFGRGDSHLLFRVQGANENPANEQTFGNEVRLFLPSTSKSLEGCLPRSDDHGEDGGAKTHHV